MPERERDHPRGRVTAREGEHDVAHSELAESRGRGREAEKTGQKWH